MIYESFRIRIKIHSKKIVNKKYLSVQKLSKKGMAYEINAINRY
jgi:hypothetical protein